MCRSVAVGGGKASKGRGSAVGMSVSRREETPRTPGSAAGRNRPARSRRSKPPRWCETTRAERERDWPSFSEGSRGDAVPRATDSSASDDGGAIFGQPQERQSGRKVGPHGSRRDGRVGVKVRRVARARIRVRRTPVVGTSRAPVLVTEGRGGERRSQWPRKRSGISPRGRPPEGGADGAQPTAGAKAPPPSETAWHRHVGGPSVRGAEQVERPASAL
jgi:hypothetical protein